MNALTAILATLYRHDARHTLWLLAVGTISGVVELLGWGFLSGIAGEYQAELSPGYLGMLVGLLILKQLASISLNYLEVDITERFRRQLYRVSSASEGAKKSIYLVELRTYISGCVTPGVKFAGDALVCLVVGFAALTLLPFGFLVWLGIALLSLMVATSMVASALRPLGEQRRQEDAAIADSAGNEGGTENHSWAVSRYERYKKLSLLAPTMYSAVALVAALAFLLVAPDAFGVEQMVVWILLAMRGFNLLGSLATRYLKIQLNCDLAFKLQQL